MDKLKEQLAPVQKHLFWILCVCILLVSLGSWYRATSHLKSEQERLKGDIDAKTNAVKAIQPNHPNDNTNKEMEAMAKRYGEDVAKAWALLAENQEKVLVWSTTVFDPDFIRVVTPLRPPELKVGRTLGDEISRDDRVLARNIFEKVLHELPQTIGAKWAAKAQAGGSMGMGGAVPETAGAFGGAEAGAAGLEGLPGLANQQKEADDSIVIWNPGNQSDLLTHHFNFVTNESAIPTTLDVLYAQEDVWILQNIMNIIKATNEYNGPISQRHEAAIKYIDSVRIGRTAVAVAGKVTAPGAAGGQGGIGGMGGPGMMPGMGAGMDEGTMGAPMGGGMPGMDGGGDAPPGGGGAGGAGGAGPGMAGGMPMPGAGGSGGGAQATTIDPADNRYVDKDYKPLKADRLKKAMRGEATDPKDLLLAVAKRVPVRLSFKMDWRRVPVLMAECGNSKLPMEIKQVRVNRQSGGGLSGEGGGMPGMGGGMMPGMAGGGMMPGMAGGTGAGMAGGAMGGDQAGGGAFPGMGAFGGGGTNPNRSKVADATNDPNEVSVEVYGIVYLYNPVNRTVLGLPAAETPATVTPTPTPASTTPPATTVPVTPTANTGAAVTAPAAVTPRVN